MAVPTGTKKVRVFLVDTWIKVRQAEPRLFDWNQDPDIQKHKGADLDMRARSRLALALAGAVGFALVSAAPAPAATGVMWVGGSTCSDTGPGTQAMPLCTIQAAASAVTPKTIVLVNPGTYTGPVNIPASGTPSGNITFSSVIPGLAKIIGGTNGFMITGQSYVTISGFAISGTTKAGIAITTASNIDLLSNTVTGAGHPTAGQNAPGISLTGLTNSVISGNHSDGNSLHGIALGAGSTGDHVTGNEASSNAEGWVRGADGVEVAGSGNFLIGNVAHDNEQSGIHLTQGADSTTVANNVAYNNGDHGIEAQNVTAGDVTSNTAYHNCTSGINVEGTSSGFSIKNNIAVDNAVTPAYKGISCARRTGNIGVYDGATSGTTVDSNLVNLTASGNEYAWGSTAYPTLAAFQTASGQGQHDLAADPKFTNAVQWNLHLTEGSPAIDSADSADPGEQATDADGTARVDDPNAASVGLGSRTYDDRGAYEFHPTAAAPMPALSLSATSGTAPFAITADGSGSKAGSTAISSYSFDFGDGSVVGPQPRPSAQHVYPTASTFTVKLTVTDAAGKSATATSTVTVTTAPPSAALTVNPPYGKAPLQVTADASQSTAGSAAITSYAFDFGDGAITGPQAGSAASHTYANGGYYTVTVTVTDSSGATSKATSGVTVADPTPAAHWALADKSGNTAADTGTPGTHPGAADPSGVSWGDSYAMFAGTGGTIATSGPVLDTTKSFTVAAWIDSQALGSTPQTMVVQQAGTNSGFYLEYNGASWQFAIPTADTSLPGTYRLTSASPAARNTWTHLVGTYDAAMGRMTFYVNGVANSSATNTTPIAANGPVVMGRGFWDGSAGNLFTGALADVRLYQKALTSSEVTWLYQNSGFGARPIPGIAGTLVSDQPTSTDATRQICMDDINGNTTNGTSVVGVWDCNHGVTQAWSFAPDGTIRPMGPNSTALPSKCLDTGGSLTQGTKITLYDCAAGDQYQQWKISPSASTPGHSSIVNPASGLCLDDTGSVTTDGNQLQLNRCLDNTAQRFLLPVGPGQVQSTEAESVSTRNSGGYTYVQGNCCGVNWSSGAQLFFENTTIGSSVTLDYYVANVGVYQLTPIMTQAVDYGIVTAAVDGTSLPGSFDGYTSGAATTKPFAFGNAFLTAGMHSFTFTVAGANSAATGERYDAGIDALTLIPATTAPPLAQLKTPATAAPGSSITADASTSVTGSSPITGYTFNFGDSSPTTTGTSPTADHTYNNPGLYTITVTVTDAAGASTSNSQTVGIGLPTAALAVALGSGTASMTVTADGTGSTPGPSSSSINYTFDFGDGTAQVGPQPGATSQHTYSVTGAYQVTLTVTNSLGLKQTISKQVVVGGQWFHPVSPTRLLDTRSGTGGVPVAQIGQGQSLPLTVAGVGIVPAGVKAVVLNVTVTKPGSNGFVTVYPDGGAVPSPASNVNFVTGQTLSNLVTVPVGADGKIDFYNSSTGVDVIADIQGYFMDPSATGGDAFHPVSPTRLMDTRNGTGGVPVAQIGTGQSLPLAVAGIGVVPAGVKAVVLNVTVTKPGANGFVTVYPDGGPVPSPASNVNFVAGQTLSNLVTVPVGADGKIDFYNSSTGVDVIADIQGYFMDPSATGGDAFHPVSPTRLMDTRNGTGGVPVAKIGQSQSLPLAVAGVGMVPAGVKAVVLNVTITNPGSNGFVTVYPDGGAVPSPASNVNFVAGQTLSNLVTVPVGADGKIDFYNSSTGVDVIADIQGYFTS